MRRSLFMYLFFFALLFIIFQYMNEKRIFESQKKTIESLTKQVKTDEVTFDVLTDSLITASRFSLLGNDNAMSYLERLGIEATDAQNRVKDYMYDLNTLQGNTLVPYKGIEAPMQINSVHFLNHRWVIANFTDGTYWGELLLEYFFDENNTLDVKTIDSVLYGTIKTSQSY